MKFENYSCSYILCENIKEYGLASTETELIKLTDNANTTDPIIFFTFMKNTFKNTTGINWNLSPQLQ